MNERLKDPEYKIRKRKLNVDSAKKRNENENYKKRKLEGKKIADQQKYKNNVDFQVQKCQVNTQNYKKKNENKKNNKSWDNIFLEYTNIIQDGMIHRCLCCDRLWFLTGIKIINEVHESVQHCFSEISSEYMVCHTCYKYLKKKKVPELSRINGFCYPQKPDLPDLNKVEERLISPRLPFYHIRRLGRDGQVGIKGNIVNIPVDVDSMVRSLPRCMDDDCAINIHLKKRLAFKSTYLSDYVNPYNLKQWLSYLVTQNLFVKHNITISTEWQKNEEENIDITENDDGIVDFPQDDSSTIIFNPNCSYALAPGENNVPVSLIFDDDAEELSFPQIYYGQKRVFFDK